MGRIVATTFVTLDGVMQGPGHPDEDRRDGFDQGGWAAPYSDEEFAQAMGVGIARSNAMLFGRRTYEHFATVWPQQGDSNVFAKVLNEREKFVVSTTLQEPLPWANSTLLHGDAAQTVPPLKAEREQDMVILGSATLVRSLLAAGLLDELVLVVHPVVLGAGRTLFDGSLAATLRLERSQTTAAGLVISHYVPAG